MEMPDWFTEKYFEKRIIQLEQKVETLEVEVQNLKSRLSSHYIE